MTLPTTDYSCRNSKLERRSIQLIQIAKDFGSISRSGLASDALASLSRRDDEIEAKNKRGESIQSLAAIVFGLTLVVLVLNCSGCNVVAWQRDRLTARLENAGFSQQVQQLDEDQIHVWVGGSGRPVVLLHGFGASTLWQWTPQALELVREYRVIMPNLLWFGESRSTREDYSVDHQVAAVIASLDELGIGESDFVGMSYGGFIAHELACAHPERVRSLVIVDSPGRVYTEDDLEAMLRRFQTDDLAQLLIPEDADGVRVLLDLAYHDPPWTPNWALRQTQETLYSNNRTEQASLLRQLLADSEMIVARNTRVQCPVLLIWGEHDPVFPLDLGERLSQDLGARLEVIAEARHFPNAEHPDEFNRILFDFFNDPRR